MTPILWGLLGAVAAVTTETWIKTHPAASYLAVAPLAVGTSLVISYCIYQLLHQETLIGATVFFAFGTAVARAAVTMLIIREPVSLGAWAAFGLVALATAVKSIWK